MVTVAVAGGTGGVGETIVEELVRQDKHKVLILSRKATALPGLDVPVVMVDYDDPDQFAARLDEHEVDVVISTIMLHSDASSRSQLNLIAAAAKSTSVKRFIPSEYGVKATPELLPKYPYMKWWVDSENALRSSRLEYTSVVLGFILDVLFSSKTVPAGKSHMRPFKWLLDFDTRRAALPGDGTMKVSFLSSQDLAKYVAALLDVESWPETSAFEGDTLTPREMVEIAERVTGERFDVSYTLVEDIQKGQVTVLPQAKDLYATISEEEVSGLVAWFDGFAVDGLLDVSGKNPLNANFPGIKPTKYAELVESIWGARR